MLEHSIAAMLADARIDAVFVVVSPTDTRWPEFRLDDERVEFLPVGGASRAESVRNGLIAIAARTDDDDRVLVHDAARPCLTEEQLGRLIDEVGDDGSGGLLAIPLADTLKRGEDGRVGMTLDRDVDCGARRHRSCFASARCARRWAACARRRSPTNPAQWSVPVTRRDWCWAGPANLKVDDCRGPGAGARRSWAEQGRL